MLRRLLVLAPRVLLLLFAPVLAERAYGRRNAAAVGIVPGAIIVDVRHGLLLPQGRTREELEPVIRDSLRILDQYLHASASGPGGVAQPNAPLHRVKRRAKRSAAGRYALNAFAINPQPTNASAGGGYYTLFARVSEAMLKDLMGRPPPPPERHLHEPPGQYSGQLFNYAVNATAKHPAPLPPPPQ
ncbi:hypothetical protein V5799_016421, partial [Amblyomma americanum]